MDCDLDTNESSANHSKKKQKKSHKKRRHAHSHDVIDGDESGKKQKKVKRKKQDSANEPSVASENTSILLTQGTGFDNQSSLMLPLSINNTMVLNNPFGTVSNNTSQLGAINNPLNIINPLGGINNPLNLNYNQLSITGHNISNQLPLTNQVQMIHASPMTTSIMMQNQLSSATPAFLETSAFSTMGNIQSMPNSSAYSMSSFIPPSEMEDSATKRKRKKERKAARREKRRQADAAALDPAATGQFIENPGIMGSPVSFSLVAKPVFKKSNNILAQTAVVAALTQEVTPSDSVTQRQYRKHGDDGNDDDGDEDDSDADKQDIQESDDETELIRMRNELQEKLAVLAEERESAVRVAQEEATPISIEIPDACSDGGSDEGEILSAGEEKEVTDQLPVIDSSTPKESVTVTIHDLEVSAKGVNRSEASSPVDQTVVKTVTTTDSKENTIDHQQTETGLTDLPATQTQVAEPEEGECETDGEIESDSEEEKVQSEVDDQVDEFGRSVQLKSKLQTESGSDVDFRRSRSPSPDIYNDLDNELPIESNDQDLKTSQPIPTLVNVKIPDVISDVAIPGLAWGLEGQTQQSTPNATIPFLNEETKKELLPGTPPVAYKDLQIIDATDDTNVSADQQKILNEKITKELKAIAGKAYEDSEKDSSDDEDDTLTEEPLRPMDMFAASDIEPDTWSDHEVSKPIEPKPELSSSSDSDSDSDDSDVDSTATPVMSTTIPNEKARNSLKFPSPSSVTTTDTNTQVDNSIALNPSIAHSTILQPITSTSLPLEKVTSKDVKLCENVTPVENSEASLDHTIDSKLISGLVETTDNDQKSENQQIIDHIDTNKREVTIPAQDDDNKLINNTTNAEIDTDMLLGNRVTLEDERKENQAKITLGQDDATMQADDDDDSDLDERNIEQKEADEKEEEAAKQMMGDIEYEKTLEKLQSLRGKVDEMSVEDLELALKGLPSMSEITEDTLPADGRRTPPHLRDIEISVKPLVEYLTDKKLLYKQLFKCINKKEFKAMLPKPLQKYDVREVRNWCLDELEIMSKKRTRAIILQQYLASSSSEDEDDSEHEELIDKTNTIGKDDADKLAKGNNKQTHGKEQQANASNKVNLNEAPKRENENVDRLGSTPDNHTSSIGSDHGVNMVCDQVTESTINGNNKYQESIHNRKNMHVTLSDAGTSKRPEDERDGNIRGKEQSQSKNEPSEKVQIENQDGNTTSNLNIESNYSDRSKKDSVVSTNVAVVLGRKHQNNNDIGNTDEDMDDFNKVNTKGQKQSFDGVEDQNDVEKNAMLKPNHIQDMQIKNTGESSTDLLKHSMAQEYCDPDDSSNSKRVDYDEGSPKNDEVNSLDESPSYNLKRHNVDSASENKNCKIKSNIKPDKVNTLDRSVEDKTNIGQKQTNKSNSTKSKDKKELISNSDANCDASKSTISGSKLEKTSKTTKNIRSDACSGKESISDPKKPGLHSTERSTDKSATKKNNSKTQICLKPDSKTVRREKKNTSSDDTDDSDHKKSNKKQTKVTQMNMVHSDGQSIKNRKNNRKSDSSSVEADSDISGKVVSHTEHSDSDTEKGKKSIKEKVSNSKTCVKQIGKSSIDSNQNMTSKKKNAKIGSTTEKRSAAVPKKVVKRARSESIEENSNNEKTPKKKIHQNISVKNGKKVPVKASGDSHLKKKVPMHKKKEESVSDTDDSSSDSDDEEEEDEDSSSDEDTSSTDEETDSDSSSDTALTQKQETKNKGITDKDLQKCSENNKKEEASSDSSTTKLGRKKLQEERLGRREKRLEKQKISRAGHKNINKDSSGDEDDDEDDDDGEEDDDGNDEEDGDDDVGDDVDKEGEGEDEENEDGDDHRGNKNNKLGDKIENVKDTKHSLSARLPPRHGGGSDSRSHNMMQPTPGTRLLPFGNSCLPGMRPPHMVLTRKEGESEDDYKSRVNWHQKQQQQMERQEGESESTYMKRLDGINSARAKNQEILADRYKKEIGMQVDKPVEERRRQPKDEDNNQSQNENKNDKGRKRKTTEKQIYLKSDDKEERSPVDQKKGKGEKMDVPLSQEEFYKMKEETKRQEKRQLKQMERLRKASDRQEEEDDNKKGDGKSPKLKSAIKTEVDEKPSNEERLRMTRFLKKEKMQKKESGKINSDRNVDKGNEEKKDKRDVRVKPDGYDERKRLRDLREHEEKGKEKISEGDPVKARELSRQKIRKDLRNSRMKHEAEKRGERVPKQRELCEEDNKRENSSSSGSESEEEETSKLVLSNKVKSEPLDQDSKVNDTKNNEINSHEEGTTGAKKSNLKELEFRARALKSLLDNKET